MGLMIKKAELFNAGPIQKFAHQFAPLTLVFGHNETGKTTILENLVRVLFGGGKRGRGRSTGGRGDEFEGTLRLTLTNGNEEFAVTKGLEAVLQKKGTSLPADLHRLLYVRAGDPSLDGGGTSLSRDLVKGLVSDHQVWDRIQGSLPNETGYTSFVDGVLEGERRGLMKQLVLARERLEEIRQLTDEFFATLSRTGIDKLRKEEKSLLARLETQEGAKRHEAWIMAKKLVKEEGQRDAIDKGRLDRIEKRIDEHRAMKAQADDLAKRVRQVQPAEAGLAWIRSAKTHWAELGQAGKVRAPAWPGYLAIGLLVLALAGMSVSRVAGVLIGIVAAGTMVAKLLLDKRGARSAGPNAELEALKAETLKRFGFEPVTVADFEAQEESLRDDAAACRNLKTDLQALQQRIAACAGELASAFPGLESDAWGAALADVRSKREKHEENARKIGLELARLGVDEEDWLEESNGTQYSGSVVQKINARLESVREELENEEEVLQNVQLEAMRLLQKKLPARHEDAAILLEESRRDAERAVRELFARLAAGHIVSDVLQKFLDEEDRRVESWLEDAGVGKMVHALTGRYNRLTFDDDELVVGNARESFGLSSLSSGAAEQVLLGIRMGIAPAVTGEESLFLLLDDAFQLSDWKRRGMLVKALGKMLDLGWQVVYFTMDDDIRARIADLGSRRKAGEYCEIVLS